MEDISFISNTSTNVLSSTKEEMDVKRGNLLRKKKQTKELLLSLNIGTFHPRSGIASTKWRKKAKRERKFTSNIFCRTGNSQMLGFLLCMA